MILTPVSPLYAALLELARRGRLVFFAGLPGAGKSLLIHQLAHLAHARGRTIHLLQWDVVRPVFEASEPGRRYPQVDGVTHGVIRIAAGRWARAEIRRWHEQHPDAGHLLIGETPFVGHRFIELARPASDAAEPILAVGSTSFVIPVPSREVRRYLEGQREQRAQQPLHAREKEDAQPQVLHALWRQLSGAARELGLTDGSSEGGSDYDPQVYQRLYLHLLRHRRTQVLLLDEILPTSGFSAYDFTVPYRDVLPDEDEVRRHIEAVEAAYPVHALLQREIERWYVNP